ncbi:MAG: type I CRISPR-associated protein Cas7 [Conexivisphaerales archaeon]
MEINDKKEFVFYYESRQNPNGDPGFDNQPRIQSDDTILVTDVRIKRTIRDYAKSKGEKIFVDFDKNGEHIDAENRAKEILEKEKLEMGDELKLLEKTFDVPLFGALVPIKDKKGKRNKKEGSDAENSDESNDKGDSIKITGPVQFAIGRSVNKVKIINPQISSIFAARVEKSGTFGKFYSVEYALLKTYGAINPANLGDYKEEGFKYFKAAEEKFLNYLWNGTNELVTRSKYPQRSIFYIEVTYDNKLYNDLHELIKENEAMKKEGLKGLVKPLFVFDDLLAALEKRNDKIKNVKIVACNELKDEVEELKERLNKSLSSKKVQIIDM